MNWKGSNGLWESRKLIGATGAIIAGLFCVHEARGSRAYLPVDGPPPLRFMEETTNYFVFDGKLPVPAKAAETNSSTADLAAKPKATETNNVEVAKQISTPTVPMQNAPTTTAAVSSGNNPPSQYYNSDFSSPAASDLLTVTPQMINEYLKPDRNRSGNGANFDQPGAVVFVPAGIQFTPPVPKASGESRATYHSQ